MSVFGAYAKYYDQLYQDKDYAAEADFVHALAQEFVPGASTLLDLGCGTGQHDLLFAERGYSVVGIDRSEDMLTSARTRLRQAATVPNHRVEFAAGDIREVRLGRTFDVTTALFHVMSYQATNEDLAAAFETARVHTRPGGIFVFDCWFGPGVLSEPPQVRIKRLPLENDVDIVRITEPSLRPLENQVDIKFSLIAMDKTSGSCEEVRETHTMRYLFAPEINMLACAHGFDVVECCQWLKRQKPNAKCWNAYFVTRTADA